MNQNKNINMSGGVGSQNLDTKQAQYGVNSSKVSAIRSYSGTVMNNRKSLEKFLLSKGMKLVTSFSEFVTTNSFIKSSFIIYIEHKDSMERLSDFVLRNPQFEDVVNKIEFELKKK
jgi:hypothetical protein